MFHRHFSVTLTLLALFGAAAQAPAAELPPTEGRTNLAAGREVRYAPAPNYGLTNRGGTNATDLTDGKLTEREDRKIWFESLAVGWQYAGRVNLAMDLGQRSRIDEVAVRFLGGSPQKAGINVPGWVEVMVSDDGERYRKVAEFSNFEDGAFERYNIPSELGSAWIHCLRFKDLEARGRYVGLRFYGAATTASDEMYVFGEPAEGEAAAETEDADSAGTGFTVEHPQPHFHKPYLTLATNLALPQPVGMVVPEDETDGPVTMTMELPEGVKLHRGNLEGERFRALGTTSDGGHRYELVFPNPRNRKPARRLYMEAPGWADGQTGKLTYRFEHEDWGSREVAVPLRAVTVEPAPRAERLMLGLGWWGARKNVHWPGVLSAWRTLGLNSYPAYGEWVDESDTDVWRLLEEARAQGFRIVNIDSPLMRMMRRRDDPAIRCQLEGGGTSDELCPSYRGPHYETELERFAGVMGRIRPDHSSQDIELWGWRGPLENAKRCTRCREDFDASDHDSWGRWLRQKGNEMWVDLIDAARRKLEEVGADPDFDTGGYDFRPGHVYQNVWDFDRLYPEYMHHSQVSTYTPLHPKNWVLVGNEARASRRKLPASDVMPWISPGDAGTFPAEAFEWALYECFTNGSRGVYFWSGRVWDGESLIGFSRAIRAVAPVEDVIVDGELVGDRVEIVGPVGRVSGMRHEGEMLLLVADYHRRSDGALTLRIEPPKAAKLRDRLNGGEVVAELEAGPQRVTVPLHGERARLLYVDPE